jgi:hypothetical protein
MDGARHVTDPATYLQGAYRTLGGDAHLVLGLVISVRPLRVIHRHDRHHSFDRLDDVAARVVLLFPTRMRRSDPRIALADGRILVTKAPSEPWPLVRNMLQAALRQTCRTDVISTSGSPMRTRPPQVATGASGILCRSHAEKGSAAITIRAGPGRCKCKEGNLRDFYEVAGRYARYEVCPSTRR